MNICEYADCMRLRQGGIQPSHRQW